MAIHINIAIVRIEATDIIEEVVEVTRTNGISVLHWFVDVKEFVKFGDFENFHHRVVQWFFSWEADRQTIA